MKFLLALGLVVLYVSLPDITHGQLPGIPLDCPVGWKKNFRNNMCYWFNSNELVAQYKASQKCGNRGGHLVTIDDADENAFIATNYKMNPNDTTGASEFAWIGLYEQREGKWVWEHTRDELDWAAPWAEGQPDDFKGEDHAVVQTGTGEWFDMRSNKDYGYICKKAIIPDPTTAAPPPRPTTAAPPPQPTTAAPPPPPTTVAAGP